jgi:hypothetical protein
VSEQSTADTTEPDPVKCVLGCLTAIAEKTFRVGRTHDGQAYVQTEDGHRLAANTSNKAKSELRGALDRAHRKQHPDHTDPSIATLRRAVDQVIAGAAIASCDDPPEEADNAPQQSETRGLRVDGNPDAIRKLREALDNGLLPNTYVVKGRPTVLERVSGTPVLVANADALLPIKPTTLNAAILAMMLAVHAKVEKSGERGYSEWTPSQQVLNAALSGSEWPNLQPLVGIVGIPVVRVDGTLMQAPGYDRLTGLYLEPTVEVSQPIPDRPSPADVKQARRFVFRDLLGDFPWRSPADRANYVALMVTPYLRRFLRSLVPLGVVSASMPSSGKTLLTGMVGLLAGQKTLTWPTDDETELRKVITTAFGEQAGVMLFDNLPEGTIIKEAPLAALLTSHEWSDRLMGGNSKLLSYANDRMWMATGNNLQLGGDIRSRSVVVWLAPQDPDPEQRTGFRISNLPNRIVTKDFQAVMLRHVLILIMDWIASGAPRDQALPEMRNFSEWVHGAGGFLAHHGIEGFLGNLDEIRKNDAEDLRWAASLFRWEEILGSGPCGLKSVMSSAAIVRTDDGQFHDPWDGDFFNDDKGQRPHSQSLERILTGHIERWHGIQPDRIRLQRAYNSHRKAWDYWLEKPRDS